MFDLPEEDSIFICFLFVQIGRFWPGAALVWNQPKIFQFCRLGWISSRRCWVSFHSTQPTLLFLY